MTLCVCPIGAALTTIPVDSCREDAGQIQKLAFQRRFSAGTTLNKFVIGTDDPALLATWTTAIAKSDGEKVIISPFIQEPVMDGGAAITYGGGNTTLGGVEEIVNREAMTFSANLLYTSQAVVKVIKELQCEVLAAFLFDQYGHIWGLADDNTTPLDFLPIPLRGFFVSDKIFGGLEDPDLNTMQWSYEPNYSDELFKVVPTDFNPLIDL